MQTIDLRSDTVTLPTEGMKEAMFSAPLGDDVFGADPSVNSLQKRIAAMFGKEAALYCPSGTMTNQIAIRISTQPQDEVICDKYSHIFLYEGGGMMYNSMVSPKLLDGDRGRITADQVKHAINPDDIHMPISRMVSLENTMNKGGGSIYKGLGAPVGSVLLGTEADIKKAKRIRKVFGGGMRQAGMLAAACNYALDHHIDRLAEDHQRAKSIGQIGKTLDWVKDVFPVDTNIVIFQLIDEMDEKVVVAKLKELGLLSVAFGKGLVRFVTHLNFDDRQLDQALTLLKKVRFN
jgi:threonine aldolase